MKRHKFSAVALGLIVMLLLGWYVGSQAQPARAEANPTIPRSWGACKGGVGASLIFEDAAGTVRLVDSDGKLYRTYGRN
jgi:hypothetical protein